MSGMFSLEGRVALVTGASRGLGFAMAKALAENGAKVVVNARNGDELAAAAAKIGAEAMAFDVTDAKLARAALEDIAARHGKLDILVNNAGIQHRRPITEWEDDDFDRVISVNLTSCFRLALDAVRLMLPNGFGRIINLASLQSTRAFPNSAPYGAGKGGIVQLTRAMAEEWSKHGVTFNAIAPGWFETDMTAALSDDQKKAILDEIPLKSMGHVDDVAHAVAFLATDKARYVTGHVLSVNGGMYM
jgi:gluconate 5-dehydrogenase